MSDAKLSLVVRTATENTTLTTLNELVGAFMLGRPVTLLDADGTAVARWKFTNPETARFRRTVYVHDGYARDLEQVLSYMGGDAHDQSKVQWYDGEKFHNLF